jgi:hypothetical protein
VYIGIDSSGPFLDIAKKLIQCRNQIVGTNHTAYLYESVNAVSDADIKKAAKGCDGVIFAMSYVVHQEFMRDMKMLAKLMHRVRKSVERLPAWFLLQDANYADTPDSITQIWPEQRIDVLADRCEAFGYRVSSQKGKFAAPHVTITNTGQFVTNGVGAKDNVCYFFGEIGVC